MEALGRLRRHARRCRRGRKVPSPRRPAGRAGLDDAGDVALAMGVTTDARLMTVATRPSPADRDVLDAVLDELRAIRHLLEQRRPSRLTREDRARLTTLLPALGGVFGSELFVAREVLEHPAPALRLVRGELSARSIGRLLQRAEGEAVQGYTVERAGTEVGSTLWRVLATT